MTAVPTTSPLIDLLNRALVRELTVCLEYMLQHAVGAARLPDKKDKTPAAQRTLADEQGHLETFTAMQAL